MLPHASAALPAAFFALIRHITAKNGATSIGPSHALHTFLTPRFLTFTSRRGSPSAPSSVMKEHENHGLHKLSTSTLVIAALGVVFGDIGTSPIYTLKECFSPHSPHHIDPTHAHILGVVSLVLWSLILLVCVKYLIFILRADNKGEGGVLSLMALTSHGMSETSKRRVVIVLLGLFGAALLFGDGIITPAISVLSAVEGLKDGGVLGAAPTDALAAEAWNHHMQWLIMGITIVILIVLFSVQFLGTAKMGRFFRPDHRSVVRQPRRTRCLTSHPRPGNPRRVQSLAWMAFFDDQWPRRLRHPRQRLPRRDRW